ncbi:MAG: EI24 domain-containing protein [Proteobacteria bacterium]|nr:EI24 domain-containing protein [Pseudomonadota bacterium]
MFAAFLKAFGQLADGTTRRLIWLSLGAAIAVFAALWLTIGTAIESTELFASGWLETIVDVLGWAATLVLTWFLFPAVFTVIASLFLERVAGATEARHYADLPEAPGARLGAALGATAGFLAAMVVLNLVMLIFLLIPPLFPFVFYGVNGYLLGREFFELVALRRIGLEEVRHLRKAHRGRLFLAGIVIAFLFTVPGLNLVAPVIATAAMVHLFENFRRIPPGPAQGQPA